MRENKLTRFKVFGESFTRRIIVPMASMIIVAIVLVLGFVIVSAGGQNRIEIESSTKLAETALNVHKRNLARNLRDHRPAVRRCALGAECEEPCFAIGLGGEG